MARFKAKEGTLSIWRAASEVPDGDRHIVHAEAHGRVVGLVFSENPMCREPDFQVHFARFISRRGGYVLEPLRSFGAETLWDVSMAAQGCELWINQRLTEIEDEESEAHEQTTASDGCALPGGNGTGAA